MNGTVPAPTDAASAQQPKMSRGIPDLVMISELTDEAIALQLQQRHEIDKIYTNIGEVVVSVNPYKDVDLYGQKMIEKYAQRGRQALPPHIFALANRAFSSMRTFGRDQCVIITGESGSGKTEAAKLVMKFVAHQSRTPHGMHVRDQLLQSNPVMEAFGNARTVRNNNSSRFGKYMDMVFNFKGEAVGGSIITYLLEKSRVVHHEPNERNFHIFYLLLAGGGAQWLPQLHLSSQPSDYVYLHGSEIMEQPERSDSKLFDELVSAMKVVGFSDVDIEQAFSLVASVLHLGNVEFVADSVGTDDVPPLAEGDDDAGEDTGPCHVAPGVFSAMAAAQLGVQQEPLIQAFLKRTVIDREGAIDVPLNCSQARNTRDALAKAIYERLFLWIVQKINMYIAISPDAGRTNAIGVLDIYGFEMFKRNGFEQICINYANEKLQQLFIELTIQSEQNEYIKEGINWVEIKYFNNIQICELLEGVPNGIMTTLDEQGILGNDSDEQFLTELIRRNSGHAHFAVPRTLPNAFIVKHYAGPVTYHVDGFIRKNNDTLFKELSRVMCMSANPLLKALFADAHAGDDLRRPAGAAIQFKKQVNALIKNLRTKVPHYVRCIKPNDANKPDFMDEAIVKHQVQYLGLWENIKVRREGYALRDSLDKFVRRYKMTCAATWPVWTGPLDRAAELILEECRINEYDFVIGEHKIFFKNPDTLMELEERREKCMDHIVVIVQSAMKMFGCRRRFLRIRDAARVIQRNYRIYRTNYAYRRARLMFVAWLIYIRLAPIGTVYEPTAWMSEAECAHANGMITRRTAASKIAIFWRQRCAYRMFEGMLANLKTVQRTGYIKGEDYVMTEWPKTFNPRCAEALEKIQDIFRHWKAMKYRSKCRIRHQATFILKQYCSDMFQGKKASYQSSVPKVFRANNFDLERSGTDRQKWMRLFGVAQKEKIIYASLVVKLNRSDYRHGVRVLVMTNKNLYILDTTPKIKSIIPFDALSVVSVSPYQDNLFVLHVDIKELPKRQSKKGDFVFISEDLFEIITKLSMQYEWSTKFKFKINFTDKITFNTRSSSKHIEFYMDDSVVEVTMRPGRGGSLVVLVPTDAHRILVDDRKRQMQEKQADKRRGSYNLFRRNVTEDDMPAHVMDAMNEQQFYRFMETGTLPRNFDFKAVRDRMLGPEDEAGPAGAGAGSAADAADGVPAQTPGDASELPQHYIDPSNLSHTSEHNADSSSESRLLRGSPHLGSHVRPTIDSLFVSVGEPATRQPLAPDVDDEGPNGQPQGALDSDLRRSEYLHVYSAPQAKPPSSPPSDVLSQNSGSAQADLAPDDEAAAALM